MKRFFILFSFSFFILTLIGKTSEAAPAKPLPAPPATKDALWWGQTWGTCNISRKIVRAGETVTISATVHNGGVGEPRWECAFCNWKATGTSGVSISFQGLSAVVEDYEPKGSSILSVGVISDESVSWSAIDPPSPPNWINEHLYCKCDAFGAQGSEGRPYPDPPRFKAGQTFTVRLRIKSDASAMSGWTMVGAWLSGNIGGLGWGDGANDYCAIVGENQDMAINLLPPDPATIPADGGSESIIAADCYIRQTGVRLPGQGVQFQTSLGKFRGESKIMAIADASGIAQATLTSGKKPGTAVITAFIDEYSKAQTQVTLKKTINTITVSALPEEINADGKDVSRITATLLADDKPYANQSLWFKTDSGYLTASEAGDNEQKLVRTLQATTDADGMATVFLHADEKEGIANIEAEHLGGGIDDESVKAQTKVKMVFMGIKIATECMDYLSIPSRGKDNPKTRVYSSNEIAEPTLFGLTKTTVKVKLSGTGDLSGKTILLESETRNQMNKYIAWESPVRSKGVIAYIKFPESVVTDANGEAEFILEALNIFESGMSSSDIYRLPVITQIDLKAELENNSDIKGEIILPVMNNYARLIQIYEGSVWKGLIWDVREYIAWPLRGMINLLQAGWANNSIVFGYQYIYANLATKISELGWTKPVDGNSAFDNFTCGNYQMQVLYFLDSIRLTDNTSPLLNGFDYGPIAMLWGGHQATEIYPQGKDPMDSHYTMILDPWPSQSPVASDSYIMTWQYAVGISGYGVTEILNLHVAPGSSNMEQNAQYPNTGNAYPNKPLWSLSLNKIPEFQMMLQCPVRVLFKDQQNNRTGYVAGLSPEINPLVAEIPDVQQYQTRLEDGTMSYHFALPDKYLMAEITAYGDGTVTIYRYSSNGVCEQYTSLPISNGQQATLIFDPASPLNAPVEFDDSRTFLPDIVYPSPTATPLPTNTPTPTPTATPNPTATPAPVMKDVRIVLGYQTPSSLKDHMEALINPLGITYEFIQENAPGAGYPVQFWQLAGSQLILYTNNGQSGRRIGTLQALQESREAGIPLFLFDNDLAWSQFANDSAMRTVLQDLTHLRWTGSSGGRHGYLVKPVDAQHPLWNGLGDLRVGADLDRTGSTDAGGTLAADHEGRTVVSVYDASGGDKVLVCLLDYQYEPYPSDRFFQNGILWLLGKSPLSSPNNLAISNPPQIGALTVGDRLPLGYTVTNSSGNSLSDSWKDNVYLSMDDKPGFDVLIGGAAVSTVLPSTGHYDGITTATIPNVPAGNYYILMTTDDENAIPENNESDNVLVIGPVAIAQPNLAIGNLRTVPAEGWPGMALPLQWTVANSGNGIAKASWMDSLFLVDDAVATRILTLDNVARTEDLAAGDSYDGEGMVVLPTISEGLYRIVAVTDVIDAVPESDNDDNHVQSDIIHIRHANLLLHDLATSSTAAAGQPVGFKWRVLNDGPVPMSGGWRAAVYLSDDAAIGNDQYLGSLTISDPLAAGDDILHLSSVQLPDDARGNHWLVLKLNPDIKWAETSDTDNNAIAGPIDIQLPDLKPLLVEPLASSSFSLNAPFVIHWKVKNDGDAPISIPWQDLIYALPGDQAAAPIPLLWYPQTLTLFPDVEYDVSTTVTLPSLSDARIWLGVNADSKEQILESDEGNNELAAGPFNLTGPDLAPFFLDAPLSVQSGETITVTWKSANNGTETADAPWVDCLYLSSDGSPEGAALLARVEHAQSLAKGGEYEQQATFRVPVLPSGDYQIIAAIDAEDAIVEQSEEDNQKSLEGVSLGNANLTIEYFKSPALVSQNYVMSIYCRIRNTGDRPVRAPWSDELNVTFSSGGSRLFMNRQQTEDLAPGQAVDYATSVTYDTNLGNHTLVFTTDVFYETDESTKADNIREAPISAQNPNLIIEYFNAPGGEFHHNQEVSVSYRVRNTGAGPVSNTGNWQDTLHLSPTGGGSDRLLHAFFKVPPLGPGESYDGGATAVIDLRGAQSGVHRLKLTVDSNNTRIETNEKDNTALGPEAVIAMPNLQIAEVRTSDTLCTGVPFAVNWRMVNGGDGGAEIPAGFKTLFMISKTLSPGYTDMLSDYSLESPLTIQPGGGSNLTTTLKLPSLEPGDYYFFAKANTKMGGSSGDFPESNMADNLSPAWQVRVGGPDLATSGTVIVTPLSAAVGDKVRIQYTVYNVGDFPASGTWSDTVIIASSSGGGLPNKEMGRIPQTRNVPVGGYYEEDVLMAIPSGMVGNRWVIVSVNNSNELKESGSARNWASSEKLTILGGPDLKITLFTLYDYDQHPETADVEWWVANSGNRPTTEKWDDVFTVVNTKTWSEKEIYRVPAVRALSASGDFYTNRVSFPIPVLAPGEYQFRCYVDRDRVQPETDDLNNTSYVIITILPSGQLGWMLR